MRQAILLYNPLSGRRRGRRLADVESAASVLRSAGVEVSMATTRGGADTSSQATEAIKGGCDVIFACGGDGTIHDVLQGLVGSSAALGIIPLGTANSLAHDLGLPLSPANAARAALTAEPRRITVGKIEYQDGAASPASHYFTVTAGVGVDAHLFYRLNASAKRRLGMASYYAKATQLWLTHPMQNFEVEISQENEEPPRRVEVSQLLAVRIRHFGGVLRQLAPGASLERDDLRLVLFRTRSRLAYLLYVMRGMFAAKAQVPGIELLHTSHVVCRALHAAEPRRIYVEADGELLGTLPATITVVPNALNILMPRR
jgi:diacylglycerol kinase (ATP)